MITFIFQSILLIFPVEGVGVPFVHLLCRRRRINLFNCGCGDRSINIISSSAPQQQQDLSRTAPPSIPVPAEVLHEWEPGFGGRAGQERKGAPFVFWHYVFSWVSSCLFVKESANAKPSVVLESEVERASKESSSSSSSSRQLTYSYSLFHLILFLAVAHATTQLTRWYQPYNYALPDLVIM